MKGQLILVAKIFHSKIIGQTLSLGCHIYNGTYLMQSLTLTIMLTLPTLLTLIRGTVVNMAP